MNFTRLRVAIQDGCAVVWLARPELRNAFDDVLIEELTRAFLQLGEHAEVRAVVLAADGTAFCAGADLSWMRRMAGYSHDENLADARRLATMLDTIARCPKPVVARVHGAAYAGGMGLVAACDIAVASTEASFCLSEVKLGLIPATISPYVVQAMGARAARRWFLSAEVMDAAEAWRIGFVHELVQPAELDAHINDLLDKLMATGPRAVAEAKRLLRDVSGRTIDDALLDDVAARIADTRASDEGREGVSAFLEKRTPAWVPPAA